MVVKKLEVVKNGYLWESQPVQCVGGDIRVRLHKEGLYPVDMSALMARKSICGTMILDLMNTNAK